MRKSIRLFATVMVCMAVALCVSCKKDDPEPSGGGGTQTVATVTTDDVTRVTRNTAVCGGVVTGDGGAAVTACGVCWNTSQNPTPSDNYTVDGKGVGMFVSYITGLEPATKYYVRAYATNSAGTSYGEQKIFTTLDNGGGTGDHEYVDLGLPSGLLWATCNVGANSPKDYGDYFAWGETEAKSCYDWSTYKWCNDGENTLTKYNTDPNFGTLDNKTVLEPEDDAAHVNWGGGWRIPTKDEWQELKNNCTLNWTFQGGKCGYRVTGSNGNSMFLPAAGRYGKTGLNSADACGYYWSSSLHPGNSNNAHHLLFDSDSNVMTGSYRYNGMSVRPVCNP